MNIIDYIVSSISELPLIVSGPSLALCAFLTLRAFGFFISIRWIRATTQLVYVFVILLFIAKYGERIAAFIENEQQANSQTQAQLPSSKQAFPLVFQYTS